MGLGKARICGGFFVSNLFVSFFLFLMVTHRHGARSGEVGLMKARICGGLFFFTLAFVAFSLVTHQQGARSGESTNMWQFFLS